MTDGFRLRRGTSADSRLAFEIFMAAVRDLTVRQGNPWDPDPEVLWPRLVPLLDHLAAHAAEWWVAEDAARGEAIGYARSVERGGLFELSEFFVLPGRQSAGVGSALLDRVFPDGRGEVRAIVATTDVRALSRYYRAGTAARLPILALDAPPQPSPPDPAVEVLRADAASIPELVAVERDVLEFDRGDEFRWLLGEREGYLYRRGGRVIGFGFVGRTGTGPIAALDPADLVPILGHLETRAAELEIPTLAFEVPSVNEVAMRHLLGRGFRMDPFFTVLMSSRPFGRFDRFIGFSPPFVL